MEKATVADVPELSYNPAGSTRRQLGFALETTDVSVNHFVVVKEYESVTVGAGEAIRFAPGEFQEGYNEGVDGVEALAIGAPKGTSDIDFYVACPDCGTETVQGFEVEERDGTVHSIRTCTECGSERRVELGD